VPNERTVSQERSSLPSLRRSQGRPLTIFGWRWKCAGLTSPRRSAPQIIAEVVEANNNGDWAAREALAGPDHASPSP
jgi:hypothetical protein